MSILGSVLKVAAPVAGFALGGPAGAMLGASASGAISGAQNQGRANKLNQQAQGIAMGNWNETAPLRSRALQMALAPRPQREDLSGMFADPGNPYSRVMPPPSADLSRVAPPPMPPAPMGAGGPMGPRPMMGGGVGTGMLQRALAAKQGRGLIGPDGLVRQPGGAL